MSSTFIEQTFESWLEEYKPIPNHFDENASFQDENGVGIMFETYGDEVEFVKKAKPEYIWTYGQGDNGATYIWNGWHFVNRLGYFITEVPCPPDTEVQVQVGEEDYYCDNCQWIMGEDETPETHECKECTRCGEYLDPNGYYCENYDTVCRDCCGCGCNP